MWHLFLYKLLMINNNNIAFLMTLSRYPNDTNYWWLNFEFTGIQRNERPEGLLWFKWWLAAYLAPGHCLTQCLWLWHVVNWSDFCEFHPKYDNFRPWKYTWKLAKWQPFRYRPLYVFLNMVILTHENGKKPTVLYCPLWAGMMRTMFCHCEVKFFMTTNSLFFSLNGLM